MCRCVNDGIFLPFAIEVSDLFYSLGPSQLSLFFQGICLFHLSCIYWHNIVLTFPYYLFADCRICSDVPSLISFLSFFFFLATLHGLWDLNSLTKD